MCSQCTREFDTMDYANVNQNGHTEFRWGEFHFNICLSGGRAERLRKLNQIRIVRSCATRRRRRRDHRQSIARCVRVCIKTNRFEFGICGWALGKVITRRGRREIVQNTGVCVCDVNTCVPFICHTQMIASRKAAIVEMDIYPHPAELNTKYLWTKTAIGVNRHRNHIIHQRSTRISSMLIHSRVAIIALVHSTHARERFIIKIYFVDIDLVCISCVYFVKMSRPSTSDQKAVNAALLLNWTITPCTHTLSTLCVEVALTL